MSLNGTKEEEPSAPTLGTQPIPNTGFFATHTDEKQKGLKKRIPRELNRILEDQVNMKYFFSIIYFLTMSFATFCSGSCMVKN